MKKKDQFIKLMWYNRTNDDLRFLKKPIIIILILALLIMALLYLFIPETPIAVYIICCVVLPIIIIFIIAFLHPRYCPTCKRQMKTFVLAEKPILFYCPICKNTIVSEMSIDFNAN